MKRMFVVAALAAVLSACAVGTPRLFGPSGPARTSDGVLVASNNGMTLYTFDKDTTGKSTCTGGCAANWPPFLAPPDAKPVGDFTLVTRDDGARQWAYKGRPLYFWIRDQKPGERTGDGFNNVWRIARP
jgi:predicted lipoprotein with Yx(FWY)xxD motif